MGKGNLLLGTAEGRIGDIVFYRRLGQQSMRAYNAQPRNPRTNEQMKPRLKLTNFVNGYKICAINGSFETTKVGQTNYNAFIKTNLNAYVPDTQMVYATKSESLSNLCLGFPFYVSNGSLPAIEWGADYFEPDGIRDMSEYQDWQVEGANNWGGKEVCFFSDVIENTRPMSFNKLWPWFKSLVYPTVDNHICDGLALSEDKIYYSSFVYDVINAEGDFELDTDRNINLAQYGQYAIYSKTYKSAITLMVQPMDENTSYVSLSRVYILPLQNPDLYGVHFCFQFKINDDGSLTTSPSQLNGDDYNATFNSNEHRAHRGEDGFQTALESYGGGGNIDLRTGSIL